MSITFPSNPTVNQTFTAGGKTWTWSGQRWRVSSTTTFTAANIGIYDEGTLLTNTPVGINFVGNGVTASNVAGTITVNVAASLGGGGASVSVGTTAPVSPSEGNLWFNNEAGDLYVYAGGGWVLIGGGGGGSSGVAAVYDIVSTSTGFFDLPSGNTAQRPGSPTTGAIRYNSTTGFAEVYTSVGWGSFGAQPPVISSVSPATYNGEAGTMFTINGANFTADAIVKFVDVNNIEYTSNVVSFINQSQLTATTPQDFTVAQEPLDVKVVQTSGQVTKVDCIDCGGTPTWSTASGTLATINDKYSNYSNIATIAASDPDTSATIAYSVAGGSLPVGVSLNTVSGLISGDPADVTAQTTYNFTGRATDNAGNTSDRAFAIIVNPVLDGSSAARAPISASALRTAILTAGGTSADFPDGTYWIKPVSAPSAFQVPCNFTYVANTGLTCVLKGGGGQGFLQNDAYWENSTLINETDFNLSNSVRSKYASYLYVPFTSWYFKLNNTSYQVVFNRAGGQISSFLAAQQLAWNDANNRSNPHFGQNSDYRTVTGADPAATGNLGTEFYMMGMDLKHEGHYSGTNGGGRARVGSICDESTGAGGTGGLAYGAAGSAFGIGMAGGNPLIEGVCGYKGWTDSSVALVNSQHSVWIV